MYFEGDSTSAEAAAKRTERSVDGLSSSTKEYGKSADSSSRSTDRSSDSLDRHSSSARNSSKENDRLSASLRDINARFTGLRNVVGVIKWPALITGAGYAAEGIGELSAGAIALTSALAPLSGALVAYPGYLGAFAQGLGVGKLAVFGVSDALKEMTTVQQGAGVAAKASAKAQETAAEGVKTAEEGLTSAQVGANVAQRTLSVSRKEAIVELRTLKDASVSAALGEERATLSLRDAKKELKKALNEPGKHSNSELESLELSVKEAKQSLKESREANREAEKEAAAGERRGVSGNPKVVEAKKQVSEANHSIALAAHAIVKAQQAETESMEETGSAASGLQAKLASMPVAGQKFAKFLFGLEPDLKKLQSTAAAGLLPGVEKGIRSALPLLPKLNTAVGGTAKVMGNFATKAGEMVGTKGFGRDFKTITEGNEKVIGRTGSTVLKWADALRQVLVVGQPLIQWISNSGLKFADWVDNAAKAGRETGTMATFFDKTRHVMEEVFSIAGNLAGAFWNIGKAAAPLGEEILESFERSSESLKSWTESLKGKNELSAYFAEAKPGIFEVGRLIRDATKDLLGLSKGKGFFSMTRALRTELLPVFTELIEKTTAAFGPTLIKGFVQFGKLLGTLGGTSGPLTMFVADVTSIMKVINGAFKHVPGLASFVVTLAGIATVEKALKFTGMVTGLRSSLGLLEKFAAKLGLVQAAEEATTGAGLMPGGVVPGVAPAAGPRWLGDKSITEEGASAGEFGEKQALRESGLLSAKSLEGGAVAGAGASLSTAFALPLGVAAIGAYKIATHTGHEFGNKITGALTEVIAKETGPGIEKALAEKNIGKLEGLRKKIHDALHVAVAEGADSESLAPLRKAFNNLGAQIGDIKINRAHFQATMQKLRSDAIVGLGAINSALGTGLEQADQTWTHGTGLWRSHTADAMRAAVATIHEGMAAGTIKAKEGQAEINRLLTKIHVITGSDPFGLADATTKQFKAANQITSAGVSTWIRKLEAMPKAAREQAENAQAGMLRAWAQGHPKIEAQVDSLTKYEVSKFGATNQQIREGVKKGATGPVAEAFKEAAQGVGGALENIKVNANDMLKALGWSSLIKFKTKGFGPEAKLTGEAAKRSHNLEGRAQGGYGQPGFLTGPGLQDTVHVMAAPGEAFLTRHQQPEVNIGLAIAKSMGIIQNGSLPELFANQRKKHYMAAGGEVMGPRATASIAGAALNHVDKAMSHYIAGHRPKRSVTGSGTAVVPIGRGVDTMDGKPVADWIDKILVLARRAGVPFTVSSGYRTDQEQTEIYESGVRPAAVPKSLGGSGSNHEGIIYPAGAVDISPGAEALNNWLLKSKYANTLIYAGAKDPVHFSHPHDGGYASGGIIGSIGSVLLRNGLDPVAAAGIIGNAYQESGWDPSAMEPGTHNGGLWGFTSGNKSLAALEAYASSQGKPWTDVATQTQFMLHQLPTSMRSTMNSMDNVEETATYFMENWEIPYVPTENLARRIEGAHIALAKLGGLTKPTKSTPGAASGGAGGKKAKPKPKHKAGYTPPTGGGTYGQAAGDVTKPTPEHEVVQPGLPGGTLPPGASALPKQIRHMLTAPGLTFEQKLSIGELASTLAGNTKEPIFNQYGEEVIADSHKDDIAAAKFLQKMLLGRRESIRKRLKEIQKKLRQPLKQKQRNELLREQGTLLGRAGATKETLAGLRETINEGPEAGENAHAKQEEAHETGWGGLINEEGHLFGEGELDHFEFPGLEEAAQKQEETLQQINEKLQGLLVLQEERNAELIKQTAVVEANSGSIIQSLIAVINGGIGGRVGLGFETPSVAGSLASY